MTLRSSSNTSNTSSPYSLVQLRPLWTASPLSEARPPVQNFHFLTGNLDLFHDILIFWDTGFSWAVSCNVHKVPQRVPSLWGIFLQPRGTKSCISPNRWHQIRSWASAVLRLLSEVNMGEQIWITEAVGRCTKLHNQGFSWYACWGFGLNQLTNSLFYLCDLQTAFRYSKYYNGLLWSREKVEDDRKTLFVNGGFPTWVQTLRH